ncbi:hypothetical protein AGDE_13511 [Angomonas deanei]|uniref:Uncharacterized protein n=1 Tax=Angomonas deanei TaxID=59799 RepID=A0A7G2C2Y9_9TRYP|nr:hypothetical protein AGDE_13511 [Angomonas deanei]CAD2213093.1 hypothetical protein, conserved [Angomonas deanei]|eukprot:EPY22223.1 hypothetical protein AGDE_13511 [Angomonas deanei]
MSNYRGGRGGGYPPQEGYGQGNYRPQRQEYPPYGGQPGYPQQQAGAGGYPHQHHHQHQFQQAYVPPQRDAYAQQAYGQHAQPTYPPQQQGYDAAQFGGYPPHQNYGDRAPAGL